MARPRVLMMGSSVGTGLMSNMTSLSLALKRNGLEVAVISAGKEQGPGLKAKLASNGIRFYQCENLDGRSPWSIYEGVREIGRIIEQEAIDIIHAQGIGHAVKAFLATRLYQRAAVVQSLHAFYGKNGSYDWGYKGTLFLWAAPKLMNRCADIVMPVSEVIGQKLIEAGLSAKKTRPLHNGIDISEFDAGVSSGASQPVQSLVAEIANRPSIIYPAVMVPWKGHRYLLEAAALVLKEHPEARFIITSDGPLRRELEASVTGGNLSGSVIFTGRLSYQDLHWLMSKITIGTFPSLAELLPMAVLDLMAASKPVVASRVDGIPEMIINGKTGFLVPPRDAKTLAARLLELIRDPVTAWQMGAAGRKVVENNFAIDIIAGKTEEIYNLAVAGVSVRNLNKHSKMPGRG